MNHGTVMWNGADFKMDWIAAHCNSSSTLFIHKRAGTQAMARLRMAPVWLLRRGGRRRKTSDERVHKHIAAVGETNAPLAPSESGFSRNRGKSPLTLSLPVGARERQNRRLA